ncbi:FecR domain-containing protein [Flammeovirgaceae bacterium SG7u.111]|nr:FecR domain-containing protein [Flammeovirgaceae bacterium SG7u.132]WPO34424.1 FecR domain-containing protein [Flammeovirgaceae bacterium SG7u.111]
MNKVRRKEFLKKKLQQSACSEEELKELYFLLDKYGSPEELEKILEQEWEMESQHKLDRQEAVFILSQIKGKLPIATKRVSFSYQQISRMAAAFLLLGIFTWAYVNFLTQKNLPKEVHYVTKSTKKGQRISFKLPDGSLVNLNTESSVRYPEQFSDDARKVVLQGEAFFNVSKNPNKPFVVESNGLFTTVLGTSFNIRAFPAQQVEVTVATGKVKVAPTVSRIDVPLDSLLDKETLLMPNQQASFNPNDRSIAVTDVELTPYLAWKSNTLYFDMVPFATVIKTLERWYDIEITFENELANQCMVRANYTNENLVNVLEGLKLLVNFEYKFTEKKNISIRGRSCKE